MSGLGRLAHRSRARVRVDPSYLTQIQVDLVVEGSITICID